MIIQEKLSRNLRDDPESRLLRPLEQSGVPKIPFVPSGGENRIRDKMKNIERFGFAFFSTGHID
jgi:hypothetical protein